MARTNTDTSERQIVAALLHRKSVYDEIHILPRDFANGLYRRIFETLASFIDSSTEYDLQAVHAKLNGVCELSDLAELQSQGVTANIDYHVKIVVEASQKRRLSLLSSQINDALKSGKTSIAVIDGIDRSLTEIVNRNRNGHVYKLSDLMPTAIKDMEYAYNHQGELSGLSTGYDEIDRTTGGFHNGDLIIIASRTSIGKTAFALNLALNMAVHKNISVGFIECEMSVKQIMQRILSAESRVDIKQVRYGSFLRDDFEKMMSVAGDIHKAPMYIDDTSNIPLVSLKSTARKMKRLGIQILYVDYLTLIAHTDEKKPRWERVGEVSKELKNLARELDIPVVVMSQLNRAAEGSKPSLAELRQSGEVEEDADLVFLIHRPDREGTETEVTLAKHRNGPCKTIDMVFLPQYLRFEEVAYERPYAEKGDKPI